MRNMKEQLIEEMDGYDEWTVSRTGMWRCPHGNLCEDDLREGHGDCGCVPPIVV